MKLVEYDWADGMTHVTYEDENTGEFEYLTFVQPASPKHLGWDAVQVLRQRPREEMIYDSLFASLIQ